MERRLELISEMTPAIWLHFSMVAIAIGIGASVLLRPKGGSTHRIWGRIWVTLMSIGALSSFWIREINEGGFSPIHILSAWTLFSCGAAITAIRLRHRLPNATRIHKRFLQSLYATGILIAGGFTFLPDRLLGRLTFGESLPWINLVFVGLTALIGLWVLIRAFGPIGPIRRDREVGD